MSKLIHPLELKFHIFLLVLCLDSIVSFGTLHNSPKFNLQRINSKCHSSENTYLITGFRLQAESDNAKNEDPSATLQTSSQIARLNAKASILRAEAASLEVINKICVFENIFKTILHIYIGRTTSTIDR